MGLRPTHREEVPDGAATIASIHADGPGIRLGHGGCALFWMLMSSQAIFIIYSYVYNQLGGLFFVITLFCSKVRIYFLLNSLTAVVAYLRPLIF
jgi:hypothetical protein